MKEILPMKLFEFIIFSIPLWNRRKRIEELKFSEPWHAV